MDKKTGGEFLLKLEILRRRDPRSGRSEDPKVRSPSQLS